MRFFIAILSLLLFPLEIFAQDSSSQNAGTEQGDKAMSEMYTDSTATERVVSPAADPRVFYDPYSENHRIQNGLYLGPSHVGIESTYRVPESAQYLSIFAGLINPDDSQTFWSGGFSYGREFRLNDASKSSGSSNVEYYFRAGPGIGIAGAGMFNGSQTEYYMGLNSTVYLGAQYHLNEKTSLFIHGGGKMFWFPSLNEVGFTTIPVISFGIQFSTSSQMPFIRF